MQRAIDTDTRVGVITTPVHRQALDAEAAIRLLYAFERAYDLTLDRGPIEAFVAEVEQHYRELAERMERMAEESMPDDRMYM